MPETAPFLTVTKEKGSFLLHLKCDSVGFFSSLLLVVDEKNHDFCFMTVSASVRNLPPINLSSSAMWRNCVPCRTWRLS